MVIGGVIFGTLVSIGIATQVVSTAPRDEYLASLEEMDGVEGLGGSSNKKLGWFFGTFSYFPYLGL